MQMLNDDLVLLTKNAVGTPGQRLWVCGAQELQLAKTQAGDGPLASSSQFSQFSMILRYFSRLEVLASLMS
jgi:hypothetical protein